MIKLFACDLDGTLLNRFHCSDKHSHDAVLEVLKHDKLFAVATGRHLHGTHRKGVSFISLPIYKVCMNGALVRDVHDAVLYTAPIANHVVEDIQLKFPDLSVEFITEKGIYIQQSKRRFLYNIVSRKAKAKYIFKNGIALLNNQYQSIKHIKNPVLKIDAYIPRDSDAARFRNFLNDQKEWVINAGPNEHHFEITARGVNKQTGLQYLIELLHIDKDQVAVYGNDINDVEMLSYFPNAYAPSNAIDAVKKVVREVVASNKKNGVAKHIVKMLQDRC